MEKRISKFIKIICLVTLFLGLTATAHASDESQALIDQGRALLFNNGEPTYSGMLSANEKFEAAVQADPTDQEANLFYAVTRILAFALEQGSDPGLETLRDLLEAFGMTRNENDSIEESPYNDPSQIDDQYVPPDTIPGGEAVRAFAAGPFVGLLDEAIANLAAIDDSLDITLTADETGDEEVEVDYGDVLVLKSALYTLKTFFLMVTAYDLDMDLRELMVLGNAGVLQIQRDLLDQYENFLSLRGDGAASLTDARQALLDGIDAYREAFNFITETESDYQGDDLFYFESDGDVREADFLLTQLTELQNSLDENRPATFTVIEERWILTDGNGKRLQMEIEKDADGNFLTGEVWGLDGCEFLFCGGWVEKFTVSGTNDVTIAVACGGWCPGSATLTATLSGNEIINGTFDATNCERSWGGTFTGQRVDTETETEIIDFNRIFGNTDKPPLDIRAVLPAFDQYSEPVPGTFPGAPVLNGILPGIQTNDDLTRELNLQPSGYFDIPTAAITIDGSPSDWPMETLLHTDISGDDDPDLSGTDIEKVYLAQDSTNLYIAMTLHDNDPNTDGNTYYGLQLRYPRKSDCDIQMDTVYDQGEWVVTVQRGPRWGWQTINTYSSGYAAEGTRFIEWKVPFSDIQPAIGTLNGKFVTTEIFAASYGESPERNNTKIQLNTSEVSGTVDCPAHTSGNIFIYAFDGPDPNTANLLGATYISEPGDYTIAGLPIGVDVYVVGLWDADFNGVLTFGDYLGGSDPATVAGDGSTVVNIEASTLYAAGEGMPYFGYSNVMAMNTADGVQTALTTQVFDSNGTLPDTIDTFTVTGPGDFAYSFTDDDYIEGFNVYWHEIPGQPADGEYTFTVTDTEGKTSTSYCYLEVGNIIPLPDSSSLQASGGSLTPALSWGAAEGYEGNLFYRARIFDMNFNIVWTSGFTTITSVDVPQGTLVEGSSYQWRVEAFDNYHFFASNNRAVSQAVALTVDNSRPYFEWAVVYNGHSQSGFYTALLTSVVDPNGSPPDSINSFTVTGPEGFSYTFQPEDFYPGWYIYEHHIEGRPLDGIYTFSLTDSETNTSVTYDYVKVHDVPLVDAATLQASGDPLSPTLAWGAPADMDQSLYFRALIFDSEGSEVWRSWKTAETWISVPAEILEEGVSYQWRVRALDDKNHVHYSNRSNSDRVDLVIDNSRPYFEWATVNKRHDPNGFFTALHVRVFDLNGIVPDSITSLTVTGPGGFSYAFQPQDCDPVDSSYFHKVLGRPQAGVYTFTVIDNEGKTSVTHDYVGSSDDIPIIDESTILVSGDPLAPTVSWSAISGYQGHLYYRSWVTDCQYNLTYRTAREPYTAQTIPEGYIEDGESYIFRVEAYDHSDWLIYNSRSNSGWSPLTPFSAISGTVLDQLSGEPLDDASSGSIDLDVGWHKFVYRQAEVGGFQASRAAFKAPGDTDWRWFSTSELEIKTSESGAENGIILINKRNTSEYQYPRNHEEMVQCVDIDATEETGWYGESVVYDVNHDQNIHGDYDNYTSYYEGYFYVDDDSAGTWFFSTDSDDASEIVIDDQVVAHWYDGHGPADRWENKYTVMIYRHDNHDYVDSTQGNPDGSYTCLCLPSGSYVVEATAPGYINEFFQEAVNWDEATPVVLTDSEGAPPINFTLLPDMDLDGMPDDWESTHFGDLSHDGSGDWDSDRLADLQEYQYGTNPNDFDSDDDGVSDGDEVNNGTDPTNASDYTPAGTGVISGTVYQTDGSAPITGDQISVEVISGDPCGGRWTHRSTLTNPADGTYAIANIAPASDYYLQTNNMSQSNYINEWWTDGDPDPSSYDCNLAQSVTVSSEGTETGKDFKLDLGGSIEGTVYQSNGTTPVTGVHIDIQALHGDPCGWRQHITSAWTDQSDGTYTIMGLPPGDYYLQTNNMNQSNYVNEWWTGDPDPSSYDCNLAQSVTVSSEGTETADFQLDLGGSIEGTVYQSDGTMAVTGVEMQVKAIQGDPCGEQEHLGWANTSTSDGTYTLMGLPPGTYYLQTDNMNQSNYVNEWWTGDTDPSSYDCNLAQSVTVSSEGTETGKDFKLDLGGSIEGTVKNSNGTAPITDADIQVQAVSGDPCGGQQHLGWAQTDPSDGTYTVMGLPPGDYYLQTNNMNQSNYINEWWASAESTYDCSGAEPIEIASAGEDVTGKDFQLDIGGSISGTVYESGGVSPIPNLHVYASDYDTDQWRGGTHTEQDGNYTITGLPSGTYKVRACASCSDLSYADECYQDAGWENATSVEVTAPNDTPNIDFSLTQMVPRATNQEAIEDGLAWLASIQNLDGSWGAEATQYALAKTALAVLSFETYAKDQGLSPLDDGYRYHTRVENGLNYIFANAYTTDIGVQLEGDPDGDGNGIGVYFNMSEDWYTTYYTSIAMMAIAACNAPERQVDVPGSDVNGWTYGQVLQDAVDYLAWGQTDAGNGRGGWNYGATNNDNTRSDQSNTGWVTLALAYAEADSPEGFGLTIPGFVRTELDVWIDYIQNKVVGDPDHGGSYYSDPADPNDPSVNMLKTGNILQQMAFKGDSGDPATRTQRVQDAIDYLVRHWANEWQGSPACYQATYTTMKGLKAFDLDTIDAINWFQDFSDAIRSEQSIHGWWPICCYDDGEKILSTEWAIMTLQKTIPPTEENPDLEVVKSEQWVDEANGTYTVSYTIKNRGNMDAQEGHDVELTVDGTFIETKPVPVALAPEATHSGTFSTVITLSGVTDEVKVCADINGVVEELNEDNNCATNIWPPPIKGDLNGDRDVDLADAILALQVLTGLNPEGVDSRADVDGDGEIGLAELIYILQTVAHLR